MKQTEGMVVHDPTGKNRPTHLVLGAPKAATSWLYQCMKEHPDVYVPHVKEIRFFYQHYDKGSDWYLTWFDGRRDEKAVVENSPSYLAIPEAAARISRDLPGVKLVCSLRNPVDRAYSHYCMLLRGGRVGTDIDSEIRTNEYILSRGRYYQQLQRYLALFAPDDLLILFYDDLKADPRGFISSVWHFLDVDAEFLPSIISEQYLYRKYRPRSQSLHDGLVKLVDRVTTNKVGSAAFDAAEFVGVTRLVSRLNKGESFPKMSADTRKWLADYYRAEVEGVTEITGRDLGHWV